MSIKGSPQHWFEGAVQDGSLARALTEVPDLHPPLSLPYALGLVVLFGEAQDPRFPRAAAKWVGRFALEQPTVELPALRTVVLALAALADDSAQARRTLADVAERHHLPSSRALLVPTPGRLRP